MRIADEAQPAFRRAVSWGAECGGTKILFTTTGVPVMTRLRMDDRRVLDTLIDAGRGAQPQRGAGLVRPSGRRNTSASGSRSCVPP